METQRNMSLIDYFNQTYTDVPVHNNTFHSDSNKIIAVIYLFVFILGLTGNTLVIFVVLRYAKMKTVTNMYILNLAVADELYILGLPFQTTHNLLNYWPFGSFLCRVILWADTISQFTSTFCLTVMSIDRYMAVVHPIRSAKWRRPNVAKVINCLVWALSFLLALPVIIFANVQPLQNTCNMSWPDPSAAWSMAFVLYTAILGFFCPLLVICLSYLFIVIRVKSAGARAGLTKRRKSERKVTRMVVIIVAVFVFCWLPFFILNIVNIIVILPARKLVEDVYFLSVILTYVNSCANPVLYGFLSDNFKQSFRKVLCVHNANGVEDSNPGRARIESATQQDPFVSPRSTNSNSHGENHQAYQMESGGNAKVELLPCMISQSTSTVSLSHLCCLLKPPLCCFYGETAKNKRKLQVPPWKHYVPFSTKFSPMLCILRLQDCCLYSRSKVNAAIYQEVLEHFMPPAADQLYGDADFIFQQDLAPAHSAKATSTWFKDHGIPVLNWPANSPDLNPIENLWGSVKRKMRNTSNNAEELKATIRATWALITPEQCHRLIDSMPCRLSAVIQAKRTPTKY
ncbi:hypothetical protein NFI96_008614 [Prochilodus magdalenae]|nr:hypothetical protein NFI96_008614 [Prochilodus magdalenae]